jgi:long-chain fatty acid transport protein
MKMKSLQRNFLILLLGFVALCTAPALQAGSPAFSGIVAEADTAESVFAAPAGMSRLEGTNMTVQGMVAVPFADFEVDEHRTEVDGGNPNKGFDPVVIPSFYYVRQLNDDWHAGFSLTIPTGFGSDYGNTWAGRYNTVDFSLVYIALTPAISYRVNDKLSLGVGVGINYTASESTVKARQPFDEGDAKITSDLDGIGASVTLSLLYEFSDRTRAGVSWTSDMDADLEGDVDLRDLGPNTEAVFKKLGLTSVNTELTNTLPQHAVAGMYHQFESGNYVTLDALWMQFSKFSVSDIKLNGQDLSISSPKIYDDFWAVTTGLGFPVSERLEYRAGAMYLSQPIKEDVRTFAIRMDEMWCVGAGLSYKLPDGESIDANANLIHVGDAAVDTGHGEPSPDRVAGQNDDPWVVLLELTYNL